MEQIHSDFPGIPRGTALPHVVFQVQAIFSASIAVSVFSAFLAIIGKQPLWDRYYTLAGMQTATEHTHDRQRTLDRIVTWYLDYVIGSLPLMLQASLLLNGCAIYRYSWETKTTVTSLVSYIAFRDVLFYLCTAIFITTVSETHRGCLCRTPSAQILHCIVRILGLLHSISAASIERSACRHLLSMVWYELNLEENFFREDIPVVIKEPGSDIGTLFCIFLLPVYFFADIYRLLLAIIWPFIIPAQRASFWLWQGSKQHPMLDLDCISWTLRTSLNWPVRLSALNYLATMMLARFDSTLVADCFDILIGSIKVTYGKVTIIQGSEQLATVSALCCLQTLSRLTAVDPRVEDIRHRYIRVVSPEADFSGLPFSHTLGTIHSVFYQSLRSRAVLPTRMDKITLITWRTPGVQRVQWKDYKPSSNEHVIVARALAKLARFEYQRRGHEKVPRWLLRFAFHSLSQDPLPPTSAVVDCLLIIAIDLGCHVSNATISDEKYVHIR